MSSREVVGRYRGSFMGLLWSFLNPILMLLVFTFVFSVIFEARWGISADESRAQFSIVLFVGMIVHGFFAEVLNRAPNVIVSNSNLVKKVLFPLEILPIVTIGAALFHSFVSLLVLLTSFALLNGYVCWTAVFLPVVLLPLILLVAGLAWILASLGVFLRDVSQTVGIVTMAALFLSPVFYPLSALPDEYQAWIAANPLTFMIEQSRDVVIWGRIPNWTGLGIYTVIAMTVASLGFAWFQKTRKGFADVL